MSGAAGAAAWAVAGARLVSGLRPSRQLPVFTAGAVLCALVGGLAGSAVGPVHPDRPIVPAVAVREPALPTTTTTASPTTATSTTTITAAPATTTTTAAVTSTTARRHVPRRTASPNAPKEPQEITARCADGWGIYGRNRATHACDTHGGVAYWIVPPA